MGLGYDSYEKRDIFNGGYDTLYEHCPECGGDGWVQVQKPQTAPGVILLKALFDVD